jgi:redox-sensitive bicupin YhaK (pirin superfamily)
MPRESDIDSPVLAVRKLGAPPWPTIDPFLFCVHHLDHYPAGTGQLGPPRDQLAGRNMGSDFSRKDGWSMYHGEVVPGFPRHPHRGFETITVLRRGFCDHSDSLGATARFGPGDAQWMTAGSGIVHSEMFPMVQQDGPNPLELFQLWINLPQRSKMVDPYFTMVWAHDVPTVRTTDAEGRTAIVRVYAGRYGDHTAPAPPPDSWAADPAHGVAVWTIDLEPGARTSLPPGPPDAARVLYIFEGEEPMVEGQHVVSPTAVQIRPGRGISLVGGTTKTSALLLQGRPIGEPVAQQGPFVMNTRSELAQAFADYRATGFGGWPWKRADPAHPADAGRFAIHPDGRKETPQV